MTDEKEIRDRLRESLPELPPSAQPPDLNAIAARARRLRSRRYLMSGLAGIALALAVAFPLASLAGLLSSNGSHPAPAAPASSSSQTTPTPSSSNPDVVDVRCDASGTHLDRPEVIAQSDGVHITTNGPLNFRLPQNILPFGIPGVEEGSTAELVFPIPPGTVGILCLGNGRDPSDESLYVDLTVLDPMELWIPVNRTLDCPQEQQAGRGIVDYASPPPGAEGDPVGLVRTYAEGLLPTDQVEPAGYPEAATKVVRILRNDRIIAFAQLTRNEEGRWVWAEVLGYAICRDDVNFRVPSPLG